MPKAPWKDRSLTDVGPKLGGYLEKELETIPSLELQAVRTASRQPLSQATNPPGALSLRSNTFRTVDFGTNLTGFLGARIQARTRTRLFVTFDEILTRDEVDWKRLGCVNIVAYDLAPGAYEVESFEPYTLRYARLMVLEGDCDVQEFWLRDYSNPDGARAQFAASDPRLNRIFEAARRTFQQNAVDVFMDCPSRERAGWLCDSFFTARAALDLCGDTVVERNFLENYAVSTGFAHLPEGMLPMCYPADHNDGVFIPNWALWFVLELEEYVDRGGDPELARALRPRVEKLLQYFKGFENDEGLLEKLKSWVFVEWSAANSFVQDVNFPSNMLYARALAAAARLCERPELAEKAARLREVIRRRSFDGQFFVDNAVRQGGKLVTTTNRTEVCQYFAFFFDVATPQSHPELWRVLSTEFGPERKKTRQWPQIHPANAFIGNQLRFELLSRHDRGRQILDEALGYWLYMADRTGTLWENDGAEASCNHGFASHSARVLLRDVLGFYRVDPVRKTIEVRFSGQKLDSCEGVLPVSGGEARLKWTQTADAISYHLETPPGYQVEVKNTSGKRLVRL